MHHPILIHDRITVRRQRPPQRHIGIQLPRLIEVNNLQQIRFLIVPDTGDNSPFSRRNNVVLPLPFGPTSPTRLPAVSVKFRSLNNVRSPYE